MKKNNSMVARPFGNRAISPSSHSDKKKLFYSQATDPLSFEISNKGTANTIYAPTSDPADNSLKLVITGSQTFNLKSGKLVDPNGAEQAQGSLLYLDITSLNLSATECNNISIVEENWQYKVYSDPTSYGTQICLTPSRDLPSQQSLTFQINGFTISTVPSMQLNLYMNFYRVLSSSVPYFCQDAVVLVPPPSAQKDLHDAMDISVKNHTIIQSISNYTVKNTLTLSMSGKQEGQQVNAGENTQFIIGFEYNNNLPGSGALTTQLLAHNFTFTLGTGTTNWTCTYPSPASQNPQWLLTVANDATIIAPGSLVQMDIGQIVTPFPAGATTMYVMYSGVPGYEDGSFQIPLYKESHVAISSFSASPNPAILNNGKAAITLSWNALADKLLLMPGFISLPTDKSTYQTEITEPETQFTLLASGESANNTASMQTIAYTLPVINSFISVPSQIHYQDFNHQVILNWDVDTNVGAVLSNSVNSDKTNLANAGLLAETVESPQMFTITPVKSPENITRNAIINAFDVNTETVSVAGNGQKINDVDVSRTAGFYGVITDSAIIRDSIDNTVITQLQNFSAPQCIKFSHDGNYLFICDSSPSLFVYNIIFNDQSKSYSFNNIKTFSLSAVPTDIEILENDQYIFVSSDPGNGNNGSVDIFYNDQKGNFSQKSTIGVGIKPVAIAATLSGSQIFIANSNSQSISVIGYSQVNNSFSLVKTIKGFVAGENPYGIAVSGPQGETLLIACKESDSLYCCLISDNLTTVSTAQKIKLAPGSAPSWVESTHEGIYAYVSNSGNSTLSLISCFMDPPNCRLLQASIQSPMPGKMAISPSDMLFYVTNSTNLNLTKGMLTNFNKIPNTVAIAAQPTDVTVSQEYAVFWHNYLKNVSPGQPAAGLYVYELDSQTITTVNADTKYVSCLFTPDESYAFGLEYKSMNLSLMDVDNGFAKEQVSIPLSKNSNQSPVAFTTNSWGTRIFAIAVDSQKNYNFSAINCSLPNKNFSIINELPLFQTQSSSATFIASVANGSKVFIVNSATKTLYKAEQKGTNYVLDQSAQILTSTPVAMAISSDDRFLYIWMNNEDQTGFAKFDIANDVMSNYELLTSQTITDVSAMTISPDNKILYLVDTNSGIWLFETDSLQYIGYLGLGKGESFPMGIAIAKDGSHLFLANAFGNCGSYRSQLQASSSSSALMSRDTNAYSGLFLRDYIGQTPVSGSGSGWTNSPDIVPMGTSVLPDPSVLAQDANYNTDYGSGVITKLDQYNNVYIRGINTTNNNLTSRVYYYQANSNITLYPSQWDSTTFSINTQPCHYLDVVAPPTSPGHNGYGYAGPLSWKPSSQYPHYCLIAWVSNDSPPIPPDLGSMGDFTSWDDLGNFIMKHPNVAWRNTNDVADAGAFRNAQTMVTGPSNGGSVTFGVVCGDSIPLGDNSTMHVVLSSPDGKISQEFTQKNFTVNTISKTFNWPANSTSAMLTYTYTPASGSLPAGCKITGFTSYMGSSPMMRRLLINRGDQLITVQREIDGFVFGAREMLLGTVSINYQPSKQKNEVRK